MVARNVTVYGTMNNILQGIGDRFEPPPYLASLIAAVNDGEGRSGQRAGFSAGRPLSAGNRLFGE